MTDKKAWQSKTTGEEKPLENEAETALNTEVAKPDGAERLKTWLSNFPRDPLFLPSLGFGAALGMAVASKLNAAPMAVVLPAAM